jgi:O-acetyl-ADP-ribose deacetylase (regulator of RNase III)
MIKEVSGDILLSKADLIAHGVAPNDPHSHGLALALREHAPAMYKDFRHYCKTRHPKNGEIWVWAGADGQRIAALFTQQAAYHPEETPGPASLSNVHHALQALRKEIEREQIRTVALPRLATGVGRLDWKDVKTEIEKALGTSESNILIYSTYHAGQAANEAA